MLAREWRCGVKQVFLFGCGAAIGGFVGILVGMSGSPIVATVVTALVGVVTAYCTATLGGGLQEALKRTTHDDPPISALGPHVYLAGFSVFGLAGALAGLYMRTHNVFSPTPRQIVEQWEEAGLRSPGQAQQVALNLYGANADMVLREPKLDGPVTAHEHGALDGHDPVDAVKPAAAPLPRRDEHGLPSEDKSSGALHEHPAPVISVFIAGDISKCDETLGAVNRKEWEIAERAFERSGGDWAKRLAQLRSLSPGARHTALAAFAYYSCTREVNQP